MKLRLGRPLLLAVFFIIVIFADHIRCEEEPSATAAKPVRKKTKKSKTKKLATKNLKKARPDRPQADRPQAQAPEYDAAYDYNESYDYGEGDSDYDGENGKYTWRRSGDEFDFATPIAKPCVGRHFETNIWEWNHMADGIPLWPTTTWRSR